MIVRRERSTDVAAARAVHASAFEQTAGVEPAEARLLDDLRSCDEWLPALSWIGELDGVVVGHAVGSRGHVGEVRCVGVGPIGVVPRRQRVGIGSALMHALIGAADACDEPLLCLLGDPGYYARFGFVPSTELGVHAPDPSWGEYFQALALTAWSPAIRGRFRYAAPFDAVS